MRILDLSRSLAGPLCTMMLGDLGADVIKVERPHLGDETRGWGPPFDDRGESAYFLSVNRNKMSLAADFASTRDLDLVRALAGAADVVVENFLPGALARHGLDADTMLERHTRLVWCTISGFGPGSPRPGYDFVIQAEAGWMAITGAEGGPPMKHGVALADVIAGKDAAIAILAALVARGQGPQPVAARRLRLSLAASAVAALVNAAQNVLVVGGAAGRWGNAHANLVPYQLFEAADRPLVLAVGNDTQWRACARAMHLEEFVDDTRFATNAGRVAHRSELVARIGAQLRTRSAAEWIAALSAVGVPCGMVKTVNEALAAAAASPLTGVAPSIPGTIRRPPPRLDEHGGEIRRLGWSACASPPTAARS